MLRASAVMWYLVSGSVRLYSSMSEACRLFSTPHDLTYRNAFVTHGRCLSGSSSDGSFSLSSSCAHLLAAVITFSLSGSPSNSVVVFQYSITLRKSNAWNVQFRRSCVWWCFRCIVPSCIKSGDSWSIVYSISRLSTLMVTVRLLVSGGGVLGLA